MAGVTEIDILLINGKGPSGTAEPSIGRFETELRGATIQNSASLYSLWVNQRTLDWFDSREDDELETISGYLHEFGAEIPAIKLKRTLTRFNNHVSLVPINYSADELVR